MKKTLIVLATLALSAALVSAQDLKSVSEVFNSGAAALNEGNKTEALAAFQQALTEATALGEEGNEVAGNCRNVIPNLMVSISKDMFKGGDMDGAIDKAKEAVALATEYGDADQAGSAQKTLGQFLVQKGSLALKAKDYDEAVESFKTVLEADPVNGVAALRLGMALAGKGDNDGALEAYNTAAANGQEAAAKKQIGKLYLIKASNAYKAKDFKTAVDNALESIKYDPSANAYKIAGNASAQLKDNKSAVEYLSKYVEINPSASDAAQVKSTIEALKK